MIMRLLRKRAAGGANAPAIVVNGARKARAGGGRVAITMAVFIAAYAVVGGRIAYLGMQEIDTSYLPQARITASRPDIVDRNGEVLATDINTASLFA
jgi:cell division protein FtsI (penicillin-binding protein 3)